MGWLISPARPTRTPEREVEGRMVDAAQRGVNRRPVSLLGSANLVRSRLRLDGPSNIASRHRPKGDRSDTGLHSSQVAGHDDPPSR